MSSIMFLVYTIQGLYIKTKLTVITKILIEYDDSFIVYQFEWKILFFLFHIELNLSPKI